MKAPVTDSLFDKAARPATLFKKDSGKGVFL